MTAKPRKPIAQAPEQRAQHKALRYAFREWHPDTEELIAGGAARPRRHPQSCAGAAGAAKGVAGSRRVDLGGRIGPLRHRPTGAVAPGKWSHAESDGGHAAALGKRLVQSAEDIHAAETAPSKARPAPPTKPTAKKKRTA